MRKNKKQYYFIVGARSDGRKNSGVLVFFTDTPKYTIYYNKIDDKIYLEHCDINSLTENDKKNIEHEIYKALQYRQEYHKRVALNSALKEVF